MRIAVIGTSGAGKSTLAARLAREFGLRHVELDALNWEKGWRPLHQHDRDEFKRRTELATRGDDWVTCGNYGEVGDIAWDRAETLIWLDYERQVIMPRVIWRSFSRALLHKELWPGTGNHEEFRRWRDREHPIRYAWDTWARRRKGFEEKVGEPRFAHLRLFRLRHPREVAPMIDVLRSASTPVIPANAEIQLHPPS